MAISSDRGLCGALHSNIGRALKSEFEAKPDDADIKVVSVGEKAKVFIQRYLIQKLCVVNCFYQKQLRDFAQPSHSCCE